MDAHAPEISGVPSTRCNHRPTRPRAHTQARQAHNFRSQAGATNVQPTYSASTTTHKAHVCCPIDCRCKIHVKKRQWVVGPRVFLSRAPAAAAQGSSSQTVEPHPDDRRPDGQLLLQPAPLLLIVASAACRPAYPVDQSVGLAVGLGPVCACRVPGTDAAKSCVPPLSSSLFPRGRQRDHTAAARGERWYCSSRILLTLMQPPDCFTHIHIHTHTLPPNLDSRFYEIISQAFGPRGLAGQHLQSGIL